jgi:hypothetical protein
LGGAAGVAFIVIFFVGGFILQGDGPSWDDDAADVRRFFVEDGDAYLVGDFLIGVAFMFPFLLFVSSLRSLLGAAEGAPAVWSRVAFAAGIITVVVGAGAGVFWGALAFGLAEEAGDDTLRALMHLDAYAYSTLAIALGSFLFWSSLVIVRTGVIWRWAGWLGLVVAVCATISALWVVDGEDEGFLGILGFIGFIGMVVWIIIVSVAMLMRRDAVNGVSGRPWSLR